MEPISQPEAEDPIDALLDQWEDLQAKGHSPSPESICEDSPDLLPEFLERLKRLQEVGQLMEDEGFSHREAQQPFELIQHQEVELTLRLNELVLFDLGGMGIVGRAKDLRLRRDVAVKFMKPSNNSPINQERFLNEARVTGRMAHPGVLPVYGYGTTSDELPFYAMRYVTGPTFGEAINDYHRERKNQNRRQQMVQLRKLLSHFVSVAYTIAYAHERGVVHCDLKPQNILLGAFGETYVIDWGLAVGISPSKGNFTGVAERRESHGAGTEGYSHPDQLEGRTAPHRGWDIYGLGAVLYKLLTHRNTGDALSRGTRSESSHGRGVTRIRSPRALDRNVPAPLETICLQALGVSADHGYERASEVADDVQRYLAGEPVVGHSEALWERVMRWQRSHQGATKTAGILLLLLVLVLIGSSVSLWRFAETNRVKTRESLETAVKFAAQTVSLEMNNRWQALNIVARDPKLVETLSSDFEEEVSDVLQAWIRHHRLAYKGLPSDSWFVCNAVGRQVARSPPSFRSIGKYYAHRDYFHGNGFDYEATEVDEPLPGDPPYIEQPHHSMVYESTSDGTLKLAYSVPVFLKPDTDRERFAGVICMSVRLGEFSIMSDEMLRDHVLILVDLRDDRLEGEPRRGLILHHPDLIDSRGNPSDSSPRPRLSGELVNRLHSESSFYLEDFVDPVDESSRGSMAAFAKVLVKSEDGMRRDTRWGVIVKEGKSRSLRVGR